MIPAVGLANNDVLGSGAQSSNDSLDELRAGSHTRGRFWAGTDARGICHSVDAVHWEAAGEALSAPALALAASADGRVLIGTGEGVVSGDGTGPWRRTGPRTWCTAVAAAPKHATVWVAGASLGGLWWTEDAGAAWHQAEGMPRTVDAVLAPHEKG